ncbi:hypothetical protein BH20ACT7_BH20ACT7_15790 [soil metagenome]
MRRSKRFVLASAALLLLSAAALAKAVDIQALRATAEAFRARPAGLGVAVAAYGAAFVVRAGLWRRVLPGLAFGQALAALHVSLAGNHLLPLRLGEALRVTSVVRRTPIGLPAATASTLTLRAADVLVVAGIAAFGGPLLLGTAVGGWLWPLSGMAAVVAVAGVVWLRRLPARSQAPARVPPASILAGSLAAWALESVVVWQATRWAGLELSAADAVLVTAVTIAAQIVALAPGGLGTYEAAATAALVALGAPAPAALAAAVTAHAIKTAYALVTGAVAVAVPDPSLLGRLRLAPPRPALVRPAAPPDGPIVLFLPAHNEEASVANVVRRVPSLLLGRAVRCLVVDDGSTDRTAEFAAAAGAEVVSFGRNRGLGAAVRRGIAEAVARGAAVVAFCDADGEYAPEELERLVGPILTGDADYVAGSRFSGDIRRMLPHRRLGNRVLTRMLRYVARVPLTDGQSGYRALSAHAAAGAEVIHDFNYAQVLTLDLLGKGYRYAEVPISYGFRTSGRSFVRLGRYLRAVVPAVHRELNAA